MYCRSQPPDHAQPSTRDDTRLPQGECRYILLHTQVKGLRCACVGFSLNRLTPGSLCDCGHQACYHVSARHQPATESEELKILKLRIEKLEESLEQEMHEGRHGLLTRITQLEESVEQCRMEMEGEVKNIYRGLEGLWNNAGTLQKCARVQEDRIEFLLDAAVEAKDNIATLRSRQIDLDDASMLLEDRVDAIATSNIRKQIATVKESTVAGPLLLPSLADVSSSSSATGTPQAWTVHISLLPTASQPFPFEKHTLAYTRCLSRGLHRIVTVPGPGSQCFNQIVSQEFGNLLRGRLWMPLVAKMCDVATLQGLPMLRQVPGDKLDSSLYDYEFLKENCATVDLKGSILDLYIAMRHDTFSWRDLKVSEAYTTGLEACWTYDPVLDGPRSNDDTHGRAYLDEEEKASAGDLVRAWSPPAAILKRGTAATSRTSSFGSTDGETKKPKLLSRQCVETAVEKSRAESRSCITTFYSYDQVSGKAGI